MLNADFPCWGTFGGCSYFAERFPIGVQGSGMCFGVPRELTANAPAQLGTKHVDDVDLIC